MIFLFQREIAEIERRAALLERIQMEREIFIQKNPHLLKTKNAFVWAKNHSHFLSILGISTATALFLLPKPRFAKIKQLAKTAKVIHKTHQFLKFFLR